MRFVPAVFCSLRCCVNIITQVVLIFIHGSIRFKTGQFKMKSNLKNTINCDQNSVYCKLVLSEPHLKWIVACICHSFRC